MQVKTVVNYCINLLFGTAVVAVPMCFMDEVTNLSEHIPVKNVVLIVLLSIVSLVLFYQLHSQRKNVSKVVFLLQVLGSYVLSVSITAALLTLFMQSPWSMDPQVAVNQIAVVSFPASLAGALTVTLFKKKV